MRPEPGTYPNFYHNYISKTTENNVVAALENNLAAMLNTLSSAPAAKADYAYAPGKWTVKQLLNHIIDAERIFAYRALCFARGEQQVLPSFEEDDYARTADVSHRDLADLLKEFEFVRRANIQLFKSFDENTLLRTGRTPAGQTTVLALGFTICGHTAHHLAVLQEKYL
jgi:uncharacterized damage-inducible protein DinB